ncbi:putative cytidine and deoxycytidylate deaminase [Synechococcus elongatus PCC 6301]|uniref:tRNA-specific adenosine deaminase n=1 Tax=Synechococcus sp. (strain ATCC 27144 / PCC 6301 / SAUG 1402/1) TaxID=269084 RepID=A0A0H3K8R6_SYNP6|nr:nucleoside deaminase [Synechococcus elongatus]BAD80428.1 putative cytidine and deoxycytidylate deaminase [Synechococcus elongatus PCC 6301]
MAAPPPPSIANPEYETHHRWMTIAYEQAVIAGTAGEIPIGAVIVHQGHLLATGQNRRERDRDPCGHAEIIAIRAAAARIGDWRLSDCHLYVTLEPCPMCAGAIIQARLGQLIYAADDPKAGAIRSLLNLPDSPVSHHHLSVLAGILAEPCGQLLRDWFQQRRSRSTGE